MANNPSNDAVLTIGPLSDNRSQWAASLASPG